MGHGTIFKITTNGQLSTIFNFTGTDGEAPAGKLLKVGGDYYGTTRAGGISNLGTVFRITTNGTLTTLVSFAGTNGSGPPSGVIRAGDGHLYGTTVNSDGGAGYGKVFRLTTNGTLTILHSFTGLDGQFADALLALGQDGALYGTTANGGYPSYGQPNVFGTIYRVTTNGEFTSVLSFNYYNGSGPVGELLADGGSFYGTTTGLGPPIGTIFHFGPGVSPVMQNVRIQSSIYGFDYLQFDWNALGGVRYGVQWNSTLDPQTWSDAWPGGPPWAIRGTNGLLASSGNVLPFPDKGSLGWEELWQIYPGEQRFFRLVLLPP